MHLGKRLNCLAFYVPENARLADVGTDHAYLPIYLVKNKKIDFAIASDIVIGPCKAASRSIEKFNLQQKISVRQGDGLASIAKGEIDTVVIAGMGGGSIVDILNKGCDVLVEVQTLILQPMSDSFILRKWLCKNNWVVIEEDLVNEANKLYEVIVAEKGFAKEFSDIELLVGSKLIEKKHFLLKEHLQNIIDRYSFVCDSMSNSPIAVKSDKYKRYKGLLEDLKELLRCL